jgi:quercetin dioxygenase-like cupin family protein
MEIKRIGTQPSGAGPAEWFTGTVRIDPLNNPPEPARVSMALVTFEPGARTTWHTHPLGQTLIVTAGCGLVHARAVQSKRSTLATSSFSSPTRSIGMARHQPRP